MKKALLLVLFFPVMLMAQTGVIKGRVLNPVNNESIPFATVTIQGTTQGAVSDIDGNYEINGLEPGLYNLEASYVGYEALTIFEISVTNSRATIINFELKETVTNLQAVEITASPFTKTEETPLSLRSIGINEIQRAPGGNRDISRVVRSLPGVASTVSFRNDIIIRGGAPGENKFYLDGIEIPTINHFQTQGSSGGPVGIINVDFLKGVDFYSGAFPVNRNNALSSVFDFKLKDGRDDKLAINTTIGASDVGLTLDGPLGENSSLIMSVRRSYLQFLFSAIGLPFLPTYNDLQFKYKWKPDQKNQITILGIGAYDDFVLNLDADETPDQRYLLNALPVSGQWNYTIGTKYEHFRDNGFTTLVLSQNHLNTSSFKYKDNDESSEDNLISDYKAEEVEYKVRLEDFRAVGKYSFNFGVNYELATYKSSNKTKIITPVAVFDNDYETELNINKYGLFAQAGANLLEGELVLSGGVRIDGNDYSSFMSNPFDQFSPRLSAAYYLKDNLSLNFNTGIYYQLPPYTTLGFRDSESNDLVNKANGLKYIRSAHLVGGVELNLKNNAISTVEGFYKKYNQYPFLLDENVSLANLGAEFGAIGNAPANSSSFGRSYGLEWMYQQKLYKGFYGILAYTFVRSEFNDANDNLVASAWDSRHIVSLTGGKKFGKNWELGVRWLFSGGAPFTPYDLDQTLRTTNWDVRPFAIFDYSQINSQRGASFHQLDLRLDKKYFFSRWTLNVYFDIQNAYNFKASLPDFVDVQRDGAGMPIVNPNQPDSYLPSFITNESGTVLPSLGVILEF